MPIAFSYTGSSAISAFVRAQGDGAETLGSGEARFIKFGTTDPIYTFADQTGAATSTAFYSNTQVVGGFAGTKTVSINNTSFTRFSIDGGSFQTANANIAIGYNALSSETQGQRNVAIGNSALESQNNTSSTES